tara:strand:- start:346 stop:699 length:354 start_codon:yes stop_codon:yes gene_type:complete
VTEEQSEEGNAAEKLIEVLISKMESMDATINGLQMENQIIKQNMVNPSNLLKKMGFVPMKTPIAEDVVDDVFRGGGDAILKTTDNVGIDLPDSNEEFHNMKWEEIHALAESARSVGE